MYQNIEKYKLSRKKEAYYQKIYNYINKNLKKYIIGIALLLIGMTLGIIYINNLNNNIFESLKNEILDFLANIDNLKCLNKLELLKTDLKYEILFCFLLCLSGTTIVGLPIICGIIVYKGFCLGYTIVLIISTLGFLKGSFFIFSSVFLQNLIYIPCLLYIFAKSLELYKSFFIEKHYINLKNQILRFIFNIFILSILFFIGLLIENYISFNILIFLAKCL